MSLDIASRDLVVLSGVRTAFGTMGGALKKLTATELAVHTAKAALDRAGVSPEDVDHVIYGNVLQTSNDAIYLARHVGLYAGVPQRIPALTVNRLCGSGFQAIVNAAEQILTGQANVVLCGGTENMSMAPHVVHGLRDGARFGKAPKMQDLLWECLTDTNTGLPMAITAENLAEKYDISREEADAYGLLSQERWAAAQAEGRLEAEIVPVELKSRKGTVTFSVDEHPRATTAEGLARLPPVFKENGTVTAGTASGICDGAASLIVADAAWAEAHGCSPLAKITSWGVTGCDPTIMGIGPVPAARRALEVGGLGLSDLALVEVNEAFAPQYLAVERELGLDRSITNVNGGAIAHRPPPGGIRGPHHRDPDPRAEAAGRALRPRIRLHRRGPGHRDRSSKRCRRPVRVERDIVYDWNEHPRETRSGVAPGRAPRRDPARRHPVPLGDRSADRGQGRGGAPAGAARGRQRQRGAPGGRTARRRRQPDPGGAGPRRRSADPGGLCGEHPPQRHPAHHRDQPAPPTYRSRS